ncbi:MAG TPA: hypothetical protein VI229_04470 [Burkholderiales bacterium]
MKLTKTRIQSGVILDASGTIGNWPFRRTVSYHVGINCDTIAVRDGQLVVQRRGRIVAIAESPDVPPSFVRMLRSALDALLHPRHARRTAADRLPGVRWEDFFRAPPRK